jgi:hypothetical protein
MTDPEKFERTFVAVSVLLGRRDGAEFLECAGQRARRTAEWLGSGEREERARKLGRELEPLARALEARRLR